MSATLSTLTPQTLLSNDLRTAVGRLVATVRATPEDKLDFKPSDTAKSIREMLQHCLAGNGYCLGAVSLPSTGDPTATDIERLIADIESSTQAMAEYAEQATDETLSSEIDFFGRPFAISRLLQTAEWHISRHAGQIDYVQTIYGDLEDHG